MNLSLPPQIQNRIDELVKSGKYRTAEDVVAAAISTLDQQELLGNSRPGELDQLLGEGEGDIQRGNVLDGDEVFAELRRHRLSRPR